MGLTTPRGADATLRTPHDGVDETLGDSDLEIARRHAHFHRVLGGLLVELGRMANTFWLSGDHHEIREVPEPNEYAKAVYVVEDLEPYRGALEELAEVQAEALSVMGVPEPTPSLLAPKVCEGVAEARILTNTGFASRRRAREDVIATLASQRDAAEAALVTFASYPEREHKRDEIAEELSELNAALHGLEASGAAYLRQHYRYTRYMCHVHYEDPGRFDQLYVGDVGVVLQGSAPDVARHDPRRRKHRRTEGVEPIASFGPYLFYDEDAWREARASS